MTRKGMYQSSVCSRDGVITNEHFGIDLSPAIQTDGSVVSILNGGQCEIGAMHLSLRRSGVSSSM